MHYINDFLADGVNGCHVDDTWAARVRAFGAINRVRVAVTAPGGHLDTPLMLRGMDAYARAGISCDLTMAYEFREPFADTAGVMHYANEPLGIGIHALTSPYIERYRLTAEGFMRQIIPHHPDAGVIIWNEPQVNVIASGDACPPGTRRNADGTTRPDASLNRSSLAPDVFGAMLVQTGASLHAAGCRRIIGAGLSIIQRTGLDAGNPWLRLYLTRMYVYLKGRGATLRHTHLGINIYGYYTVESAQRVKDALRATMDAYGDTAELLVTEWGARTREADPARLVETGRALETVFGDGAFFMRPGFVPYLGDPAAYTEYGLEGWRAAGGRFIPGPPYPLYPIVQPLYR